MRIDVVNSWYPDDPDEGCVGMIFKFTKEDYEKGGKAESIPDGLFECGEIIVMAKSGDSIIVLIAYHQTVNYEDSASQGYMDCEMIYSGMLNGEYEVYL